MKLIFKGQNIRDIYGHLFSKLKYYAKSVSFRKIQLLYHFKLYAFCAFDKLNMHQSFYILVSLITNTSIQIEDKLQVYWRVFLMPMTTTKMLSYNK